MCLRRSECCRADIFRRVARTSTESLVDRGTLEELPPKSDQAPRLPARLVSARLVSRLVRPNWTERELGMAAESLLRAIRSCRSEFSQTRFRFPPERGHLPVLSLWEYQSFRPV